MVAGCADNTVRVLSLESADCLQVKATQATASAPHSVALLETRISAAGVRLWLCRAFHWYLLIQSCWMMR